MEPDQVLAEMEKLTQDSDFEASHGSKDDLLCEFVRSLGYIEIADAYEKGEKWYA